MEESYGSNVECVMQLGGCSVPAKVTLKSVQFTCYHCTLREGVILKVNLSSSEKLLTSEIVRITVVTKL